MTVQASPYPSTSSTRVTVSAPRTPPYFPPSQTFGRKDLGENLEGGFSTIAVALCTNCRVGKRMPNAVACTGVSMRLTELRALDLRRSKVSPDANLPQLDCSAGPVSMGVSLCAVRNENRKLILSYIAMPEETMNV